jgi:hypothetical protein
MRRETELKTEFVSQLKIDGWYARRLEDKYAVGVPDIMLAIPFGPAMLVEAKIVHGNTFAPTARQKIDLDDWERDAKSQSVHSPLYRIAAVLGYKDGVWYIGKSADSLALSDCIAQIKGERNSEFLIRYWHRRLNQ